MRLVLSSMAAWALLITSASAAGNFEFAVPAPPGLVLEITGYAADGSEMFRERSGPSEQRNGAPAYVVRIDETVVRSKPLAKWCVTLESGTWDAVPAGSAELCDETPSETRGMFLFAATAETTEKPAATVAADTSNPLSCIAGILGGAGYLVAPPETAEGEVLRRAAIRFIALQPENPGLPLLDDGTQAEWCSALEGLKSAGIEPPPEHFAKLHFGPDVSIGVARDTVAALRQAIDYFDAVVGYRLKHEPALYISADADWLTAGYASETPLPRSQASERRARFAACGGGEATFGLLFMCTSSPVFSEDWYGAGLTAQRAYALAHEWFHVIQDDAVGQAPLGCCDEAQELDRKGPVWLIEGSAEYMAMRLLADSKLMDLEKELRNQAGHASRAGVDTADLQTRGGAFQQNPGGGTAVGILAVRNLLGTVGAEALPRYWQALGAGLERSAAFERAFGIGEVAFHDAGDRRLAEGVGEAEMVMCVQDALNQLGFDAGSVDGALGRGTRAAFAAYLEKHPVPGRSKWEIANPRDAGTPCLYLDGAHDLGGNAAAIADRLAVQAAFSVVFPTEPRALRAFSITDGGRKPIVETDIFSTRATEGGAIKQVRLPYGLVRNGAQACIFLADGWIIRGGDGKGYTGSCDAIVPAFGTSGIAIGYKIERGSPG